LWAGLLISNLAFLAALIVLFALTAEEYSLAIARRTLVLLAVFPTSFFFLAPYGESLYLLFVLIAFREARRARWGTMAASGIAASLTRAVGWVMAPALLVDTWRKGRAAVTAALVTASGMVGYLVYWRTRGNVLAPFEAQTAWHREFRSPLWTLARGTTLGIQGATAPGGWYWTVDLVITIVVVAAVCIGWRHLRPTYQVYAAMSIAVPVLYPFPPRPLLSMPRFLLVVFPAMWAGAVVLRDRRTFTGVSIASAAGWLALATAFITLRPIF
jgi:hypothetical protein